MDEQFTSRVGHLIRFFRIASDMTQKELADKCGLNESTIRNYELGNRYPDAETILNIANNLNVSFYSLSEPDVSNIFSALHILFDIERIYGLHPTKRDGELIFKFEESPSGTEPHFQKSLDSFRKMVECWALLRNKLEDGEITDMEYYLKKVKFPMNAVALNKDYVVSLNLDDDQLMIQNINKNENSKVSAEVSKDLFPNFSHMKRKRKPIKEK